MKSLKQIWIVSVLLLISFSQVNAQGETFDESILSESGSQAYRTLLKTELFAMSPIGYGGESSEGRKALYELLKEGKAKSVSAFRNLVKEATIEGGLYGLVGLRMWRCICFQDELENFKSVRLSENNKEKLTYKTGYFGSINYKNSNDKREFVDFLVTQMFASWAR